MGWRTPNNIRALRLAVRPSMTQRELAVLLHCTQQEVAAWENGTRVPSLPRAIAIAVVLNASVEDVFFSAHAVASASLENRTPAEQTAPDLDEATDAAGEDEAGVRAVTSVVETAATVRPPAAHAVDEPGMRRYSENEYDSGQDEEKDHVRTRCSSDPSAGAAGSP